MSDDPIQTCLMEGDFDGAVALVSAALDEQFAPELGVQLFGIHTFRDDPDAAEQALRRVVEAHPDLQVQALFDCLQALRAYLHRRESATETSQRNFVLGRSNPAPPPWLARQVQAAVEHASGEVAAAAASVQWVKTTRPDIAGEAHLIDGSRRSFQSICDADDLHGTVLHCFSGPHLLDIPFTELQRVDLGEVRASWDTIWRPIKVALRDGRQFAARMPTRYPRSGTHPDALVRLGRMTLLDHDRGYAIGWGMIDYILDEVAVGVERITSLRRS